MRKKHKSEPEAEKVIPVEDKAGEDQPVTEQVQDGGPTEETKELCAEDRLRIEIKELEDKLLRTAAEFENYKKRVARQYEDVVRSANDSIITELLDIVDNFERALNHDHENTDLESFRKGTELIFTQMMNLLKKYDIEPIDAVGQPFDPNIHDAMLQIDTDEYDEGIVALEMAKGYRQGQRVIRHSRVGVSTGKKKED
ncbi:MAG: nucleotide exchange factor GrpE [Candidatus Zixiibacteriota bacterium]|nr:MAG: nucleotide exchange factor GrpE [candidate division Zixibacteria bacterium]